MASRKHPGNLSSDMGSPSSPSRSHSRPSALSVDLDGNASTRNRADTNSTSVASRSVPPTPASSTKRSKKAIVVNTFGAGQVQEEQLTQVDIKLRNQQALLDFRNKILEKFTSVSEAFETFARNLSGNNSTELSKKDWKKMFLKHGFEWPSREERDAVL